MSVFLGSFGCDLRFVCLSISHIFNHQELPLHISSILPVHLLLPLFFSFYLSPCLVGVVCLSFMHRLSPFFSQSLYVLVHIACIPSLPFSISLIVFLTQCFSSPLAHQSTFNREAMSSNSPFPSLPLSSFSFRSIPSRLPYLLCPLFFPS